MFTSAAELESKVGAARLVEYADEDHDGVADASVLAEVVAASDREVRATLRGKGWKDAQLEGLETDEFVRALATSIAADRVAGRRAEHKLADGTTLYTVEANQARKDLTRIATAELRPDESVAGAHRGVRGHTTTVKTYILPNPVTGKAPGGF